MRKYKIIGLLFSILLFNSCDFLDVDPINIIQESAIFSSESGINAYMATMYYDLPIEDFRFSEKGFNVTNEGRMHLSQACGEAMSSTLDDLSSIGDGSSWELWDYGKIRRVNEFIQKLNEYKSNFTEAKYEFWLGEAYFIRAYCYFAMVKRYGGVPIVKVPLDYDPDNLENLEIPRSTEKDCYDFIAEDLDIAIKLLPVNESYLGQGRATKYAALALKSRAMLYAGSIARYGTLQLDSIVGIDANLADHYFELSYNAADSIILSNRYSLYRQNSDLEKNFAELFLADDSPENIFVKYYALNVNAHGWDVYFIPYQYPGNNYSSYMNPPLEFVDRFEQKDGEMIKFEDKAADNYYANPADLFTNMDARFGGSIIYPNSVFKGDTCSIQKGLIDENGNKIENAVDYESAVYTSESGTKYHIVGKSGCGFSGNNTGFFIRKYLNEDMAQEDVQEGYSTQHWIDFRYAEVLLNAAEASTELGQHLDSALIFINDIRNRAGLKSLTSDQLTIDKVRHERRIELAFENQTYWDLRRWRIFDKEMEATQFHGLWPYLDVRTNKYVFVVGNVNKYYYTFYPKMYYEMIPSTEISTNSNLVQNPLYN